ncbi:Uncharacterized protein pbN1_40420 [Aromatoleum bremense]|nr:Uncharacterized protein pbN1_40420 [Aromatoleum bremense]
MPTGSLLYSIHADGETVRRATEARDDAVAESLRVFWRFAHRPRRFAVIQQT